MLRGVVMTLRLHPLPKQYSYGVLIKRIIESSELAICWIEAQKEEIQDLCCFTKLYFPSQFSLHLPMNRVVTTRRKYLHEYNDVEDDW